MAFTKYQPPAKRLLVSLWGAAKRRKTSLALTFPSPIYYLDHDFGLEGLGAWIPSDFHHSQILIPEEFDLDEGKRLLGQVLEDFQDACEAANEASGTVVIDTATQVWQL